MAAFVGKGSLLEGELLACDRLRCALGDLEFAEPFADEGLPVGTPLKLFLRPCDLRLTAEGNLPAEVLNCEFHGSQTLYRVRLDSGLELEAVESGMHRYPLGEQLFVQIAPHRPIVFFDQV